MATAELPRLLTTRQAAAALNVSQTTIRRLIASGRLPAVRVTEAGALRVDVDDLRDLIDRSRRGEAA